MEDREGGGGVSRIHPVNHLQSITQLQVWWVFGIIHGVNLKTCQCALVPDSVLIEKGNFEYRPKNYFPAELKILILIHHEVFPQGILAGAGLKYPQFQQIALGIQRPFDLLLK